MDRLNDLIQGRRYSVHIETHCSCWPEVCCVKLCQKWTALLARYTIEHMPEIVDLLLQGNNSVCFSAHTNHFKKSNCIIHDML